MIIDNYALDFIPLKYMCFFSHFPMENDAFIVEE